MGKVRSQSVDLGLSNVATTPPPTVTGKRISNGLVSPVLPPVGENEMTTTTTVSPNCCERLYKVVDYKSLRCASGNLDNSKIIEDVKYIVPWSGSKRQHSIHKFRSIVRLVYAVIFYALSNSSRCNRAVLLKKQMFNFIPKPILPLGCRCDLHLLTPCVIRSRCDFQKPAPQKHHIAAVLRRNYSEGCTLEGATTIADHRKKMYVAYTVTVHLHITGCDITPATVIKWRDKGTF